MVLSFFHHKRLLLSWFYSFFFTSLSYPSFSSSSLVFPLHFPLLFHRHDPFLSPWVFLFPSMVLLILSCLPCYLFFFSVVLFYILSLPLSFTLSTVLSFSLHGYLHSSFPSFFVIFLLVHGLFPVRLRGLLCAPLLFMILFIPPFFPSPWSSSFPLLPLFLSFIDVHFLYGPFLLTFPFAYPPLPLVWPWCSSPLRVCPSQHSSDPLLRRLWQSGLSIVSGLRADFPVSS